MALRGFRVLARDFKGRPWTHKAYIAAKLVAGPVGVLLVAIGIGDDHVVLVVGIALVGVFLFDSLLVHPILRARHDLKRARSRSDSS
jgi:hypothetical protein